jgi:hypothetical protein
LFPAHVHPVPVIDTSVSPAGRVSVTVTVPLVNPALAAFDTVSVYVAFCCPCVKFPTCVFVTLNTAGEFDKPGQLFTKFVAFTLPKPVAKSQPVVAA